ncbi:MAG: glycoside hydrolase family 5 protein [Isosphaeraceae bacterium]
MNRKQRSSKLGVAFILPLLVVAPLAAGEPVKLASSARFDLSADSQVGAIEGGKVSLGNGTIARKNWVVETEQPLGYTVNVPVARLGWRLVAVRFTPQRSGTVTLTLMGPYDEASKGVLYRQEVLWDDVRVDGARLGRGGFEWRGGEVPAGWQSGGGTVIQQTAEVAAVEGSHYARTWHNQTLSAVLQVTAGRPVTISVNARAARPAGFSEPKRIASRSTPAHDAARRFLRGANLGNGLEVPPGQDWGVHYTAEDLHLIRAEGFDHVRIPIGWHHYTGAGPAFLLRPEIFARADVLVDAGLRERLSVIINIHHFDQFTSDPKRETARFLAIWRQLSAHYARVPEGLAFELLNEPKDSATTEVINPIFAEAIEQIRRNDPKRTIFVGPGRWNSIAELPVLRLPDGDENLIVTVHNYNPFYFSHQGATWAGPDTKLTGIVFPGPPPEPLKLDPKLTLSAPVRDWVKAYNVEPTATNPSSPRAFQAAITDAREWSLYYGRPIHVGEFGCFTTADPRSRANYYRAFREAAETAQIGWALWDWKASFRYWNQAAGRPEPGMHDALFGTTGSRESH